MLNILYIFEYFRSQITLRFQKLELLPALTAAEKLISLTPYSSATSTTAEAGIS